MTERPLNWKAGHLGQDLECISLLHWGDPYTWKNKQTNKQKILGSNLSSGLDCLCLITFTFIYLFFLTSSI